MHPLSRKDGRVVYCVGLENRSTERYRGFESLSFRFKKVGTPSSRTLLLFFEKTGPSHTYGRGVSAASLCRVMLRIFRIPLFPLKMSRGISRCSYFFCIILFQREGEGTDEVAVAEEIDGIKTLFYLFIICQGIITNAFVGLSFVLNRLHQGIGDLSTLECK